MTDDRITMKAGTIARCNRCDAKGALPRDVEAMEENSRAWRILDMVKLPCGHLDSHWVYKSDLTA